MGHVRKRLSLEVTKPTGWVSASVHRVRTDIAMRKNLEPVSAWQKGTSADDADSMGRRYIVSDEVGGCGGVLVRDTHCGHSRDVCHVVDDIGQAVDLDHRAATQVVSDEIVMD